MTFINYKGTHVSTRKVSDVFNVYVKEGSVPSIQHSVLNYEGSTVHVLKIKPSETTTVNMDFAGDVPKNVAEIRNEWMIQNGWIHVAGINAGYFDNHSGDSTYGKPVGAVLTDWAKTWSNYKTEPCFPCKGKGYPTIYSDGYSLQYIDGWASDFDNLLGHMLWARGVGQSLTINGQVDSSAGKENGRYNSFECVSMIGMDADGNWMLVMNAVKGLNHLTRSYLMQSLGAVNSFDLDGGGSAQMWWADAFIDQKIPSEEIPETNPVSSMRGIDISNWQAGLDLTKIDFDFVICKSTDGIGFVDKYCDKFIQTAEKIGNKKIGFYHFGRPTNDPVAEAEFWYKNTKNYFGKYLPVLDVEVKNSDVVEWCRKFLVRIEELSGVKPILYTYESFLNSYNWTPVVNLNVGLWIARYRDSVIDKNYDMSNAGSKPSIRYWTGYAMWQWTSSGRLDGYAANLDCNEFYGDGDAWDKYAGIKKNETPSEPETDPAEKPKDEEGTNTPSTGKDEQSGSETDQADSAIMKLLKMLYELLRNLFEK